MATLLVYDGFEAGCHRPCNVPLCTLITLVSNRFKMLLMAEQVHENHLQAVLSQGVEQLDWAGEPAWEDSFSVISSKYGQRVRQCLFWWGGALAHLRWKEEPEECCRGEEVAAQVAVVLGGDAVIAEEPCGPKRS